MLHMVSFRQEAGIRYQVRRVEDRCESIPAVKQTGFDPTEEEIARFRLVTCR